jgi:glutathione reductase (NADPH)|tara:strand:+ start:64 stop:1443 length:1380 start_codon:yes stop_codon:yes gene_type:complete
MTHSYDYDLFVIGAGSGGVRLARMSASMGAKVAVAEDRYLGGTCVNVGCVPKKLFVYASHVSEELHDGAGFGWSNSGDLAFSWPKLIDNKNIEITRLNGIYQNLLDNSGAQIIDGRARFVDAHTVEVNGKCYSAERIVIATGSWPFIPDFIGKEHAISSNELFYLPYLPSEAIVVGGGYIAVEMAGILNGLGVKTTLVYRGDMFLRGFDEEIRQFVKEEMIKKGVVLKFNDNISSIKHIQEPERDLVYQVNYESGEVVESGMVLYATGRVPHTQDLGLENINIDTNKRGEIVVNQSFQSSEKSVYALGDVTGGMQLTPVALAEGMYLAHYLYADKKPKAVDYTNIATAVFCQPTIGTVGLTEEQARAEYGEVSVFVSNFKPMKHTLSGSDERCLMKMIVDKASDKVVGIHMVGAEAGEIIQGMAVAIKAGATKQVFDETIGIHPTAAEEFVTMRQARSN